MKTRRITLLNYFGGAVLMAVAVFVITVCSLQLANAQRPCVPCTTDSDCARKNGGDGDPAPAKSEAFYCGAVTKKGTPCKHRVKAKGLRCKQHGG